MRNLLHRAGYIEKMGTGITKMRRLIAEAGLPPIEFEFGTFFTAIFRRPTRIERPVALTEKFSAKFSAKFDEILRHEGVSEGVNDAVNDTINEPDRKRKEDD